MRGSARRIFWLGAAMCCTSQVVSAQEPFCLGGGDSTISQSASGGPAPPPKVFILFGHAPGTPDNYPLWAGNGIWLDGLENRLLHIKIDDDLGLWRAFRHVKPPQER